MTVITYLVILCQVVKINLTTHSYPLCVLAHSVSARALGHTAVTILQVILVCSLYPMPVTRLAGGDYKGGIFLSVPFCIYLRGNRHGD
jgi:hypothetical protein